MNRGDPRTAATDYEFMLLESQIRKPKLPSPKTGHSTSWISIRSPTARLPADVI